MACRRAAARASALLWASSRIGSQSRTIHMESSYFDTADGMLTRKHQAALRLRRENERSVCCMKLRGTDSARTVMRAHEEYQCEAVRSQDGLRSLPEQGRTRSDLCERTAEQREPAGNLHGFVPPLRGAAAGGAIPCASWRSTRASCVARVESAPLCEIELEYVAGSEGTFHALAAELAQQLDLVVDADQQAGESDGAVNFALQDRLLYRIMGTATGE